MVPTTKHIHVTGVVQGVGFRPFVYGLATRLQLQGWVCNTSAGVDVIVQGDDEKVNTFVESLSGEAPRLARIEDVSVREEAPGALRGFEIRESQTVKGAFQPVSPDLALCPECERELFNPKDRRYLYSFINCTNCGPRFTIIKDLPYDRPATTMAEFPMCEACRAEYEDPTNRRFHAQPIACPDCGPFVQLRESMEHAPAVVSIDMRWSAIVKARKLLCEGKIVAIKGLGGFHLACDATNEKAVAELRRRKGRAGKPFALMFSDSESVHQYCIASKTELILLNGHEKPIVLLKRRIGTSIAPSVAPEMDTLGVMLPYTPLHHLLLNQTDPILMRAAVPPVLVMTSGNFSEEPIATDNVGALEKLAPLADAFLIHNREIHIRCDDSVVRVDNEPLTMGHEVNNTIHRSPSIMYLRRSRAYAPYPVMLPFDSIPSLAVGGELKNTFCLTRERYACLSHHIGDMENAEVYESFERGVEHLSRLFRVKPEMIAHDMHPGYFTTRYANAITDIPRIPVQHHHAHIAACMADNHLSDRQVIGLSFDGTGYGTDGRIWGGEVLLASYADFERVAHLEYLPLPGGDAAIHHPWRIAVGYAAALGLDVEGLPFLKSLEPQAIQVVRKQVERKLNVVDTSSMGRLFDAVACLTGIRNQVTYEAQAAIELEVLSKSSLMVASPYPYEINGENICIGETLKHIIEDVRRKKSAGFIGACFHQTLAAMTLELCTRLCNKYDINEVVLSGGVWQNQLLLDLVRSALIQNEFIVYTHRQTPANDGGLALGQAAVAAVKLKS
ncbi:MAG TPA: carbamoyltransferase HypF [Anaerolineales bacterium]|nr:carbamoyltransferase HypF [Anaerolineales bacterium]